MATAYPLLGGGVPSAIGMGLPLPDRPPESTASNEGPLSAEFVKRLHDQIGMSERELEAFRAQNKERQELYAGHGYGDNESDVDTPLNVYNMALRIYQRRLISGEPAMQARARSPRHAPDAYELSLACEQLFREIKLKDTMKEVVHQGLESVGVVKVGIVGRDQHENMGFLHDGDQPFCDPILLENFAFDTNAKRWEEIDWCGDKYRIAVEDLEGNPEYDQSVVASINKGEQRQDEDLTTNAGEESVQRMGVQQSVVRDELRQYVTVWDIWLPREGVIVTIPADGQSPPLRVVEWDGPENGPYHLLRFDPIPGNILPVSPGSHLESLAKLLNRAIRKLGNQLDRQRTNPTITPNAANAGDDRTIQDAEDGDVLQLMDPKNVGEVRVGGIDQQSYAFTQGLIDLYQWLGGNLNSLGGLASDAGTATQQELEAAGANGLIDELQDRFMTFLKGVMTDLAWYEYTDPNKVRKVTKRVEGTDIELPDRRYGPENRQRSFFLFEFDVDPFSVRHLAPEQRLQQILDLVPRMAQIAQAAMVYSQVGLELDVESLWRLIARNSGFTELSELIHTATGPITAEPKGAGDRMPSMNVGGMPREYIRRNVSSGGGKTGMAPGQQALQMMLSAGNQGGNGAAQG